MSDSKTKIIVAGSRTIDERWLVESAIMQQTAGGTHDAIEIVSGGAKGPDTFAKEYAEERGIKYTQFDPQWNQYGPAAGPMRNEEMAEYGDTLIAIWDGQSSGTKDMIDKALEHGLDTHVYIEDG